MKNYILADNQYITRAGVISLLKVMDNDAGICEAASYRQLLEALRTHPCSVVVVDYSLFDFLSMNHLLNMKSGAGESSWLLFSDEPEEHFLRQLLLADPAISVVMKHGTQSQIKDALMSVAAGEVYWCDFSKSVMRTGVPQTKIPDPLTPSEKNILREIALGKTTKEIAAEKYLSFHTINAHRRNIYRKLKLNSVNEVTRYALQAGLIDLMEYYI
ncbi:MAG: response regulator transcription factor [Proteiniphilum sp.]|nr:response regulator transcription factor [Proteiniphilum sp.]